MDSINEGTRERRNEGTRERTLRKNDFTKERLHERTIRSVVQSCSRAVVQSCCRIVVKSGFLVIVCLLVSVNSYGQDWIVPPDDAKALSFFPFTDETRSAGQALYTTNCKSCHGDPGQGNTLKSVPPPPDPASENMQKNTDGEMFHKISVGRTLMPPFKNILSAKDIWTVISYVRSFNKQYKQQLAQRPEGAFAGKTEITLRWLKDSNRVEAILLNKLDKVIKPLEGAGIQLYAERYFGNLEIDKVKNTNGEGKAYFDFPTDLPGDSAGNISILAKLEDEGKYGEIKADTFIKAGIPTWKPALNEQRAMWNIVQKAPLWLLFSYLVIVLSIWGVIFYVLYLLRMIFQTGKQNKITPDY